MLGREREEGHEGVGGDYMLPWQLSLWVWPTRRAQSCTRPWAAQPSEPAIGKAQESAKKKHQGGVQHTALSGKNEAAIGRRPLREESAQHFTLPHMPLPFVARPLCQKARPGPSITEATPALVPCERVGRTLTAWMHCVQQPPAFGHWPERTSSHG